MTEEKQIEEMACKNCIHYEVCMYVNAQAVEYARAENCKLFKNNAGYRKQSEGEWTFDRDNALSGIEPYRCSACGGTSQHRRPYCSLCGAKMKGGAE